MTRLWRFLPGPAPPSAQLSTDAPLTGASTILAPPSTLALGRSAVAVISTPVAIRFENTPKQQAKRDLIKRGCQRLEQSNLGPESHVLGGRRRRWHVAVH